MYKKELKDYMLKKWGKLLPHVTDEHTAVATAILLENEHKMLNGTLGAVAGINESFSTSGGSNAGTTGGSSNCMTPGGLARFKPIAMPLVARIFPELVANELVGVQPLQTPVGLAFAMRYRYASGDFNGQEAGYNTVHSLFSGVDPASAAGTSGAVLPTSGSFAALPEVDNGRVKGGMPDAVNYPPGYSTQNGELLGEYGNVCGGVQETLRYMGVTIESQSVTAKTRKLAARWTYEAQQDANAMHGIDLGEHLSNVLSYEVAAEIDAEVKNNIIELAKVGGVYYWNYGSVGAANGTADGRWEQEKFRTLYTLLVKASNDIARTTRVGAGNFILCSANVVTALESLEQFAISSVATNLNSHQSGVAKVGTIGPFTVYRDVFATVDYAVVGFKGDDVTKTGLVYMPYVPLQYMEAVGSDSFNPRIGVMTRYGIANNLFGSENFYRYVSVNFGNSTVAGYSNAGAGYAGGIVQP